MRAEATITKERRAIIRKLRKQRAEQKQNPLDQQFLSGAEFALAWVLGNPDARPSQYAPLEQKRRVS
jgi:hypothetical protein